MAFVLIMYNMKNKKILVLVLCSSSESYPDLENSIKDTWFNIKNDDIDIIFYKDNQSKFNSPSLKDNDLFLPCEDGFFNIGIKTLLAFEWVTNNYNYEYIYRTNLGSFVDSNKLLQFVQDKSKTNFYCGIVGRIDGIEFASGSGYFLSKDLVKLVLTHSNMWPHDIVDDVALGKVLNSLNVFPNTLAKRLSFCDNEKYYQIGDEIVDFISNDDIYHIRLRSNNRELDIKKMKELYDTRIS